ncbi:MAG: DoxX family protein [Chthonomonas sp.]|nr:DoxX family protein [Chthonomonas sp.]
MNDAKLTNIGLLALRISVGLVMVLFGAQKLLGAFGGAGFNGTIKWMGSQGIPSWLAALAIFAEFFGGLGLIFGVFTRFAAFGVACTMGGALITKFKEVGWQVDTQANAMQTFSGLGFPLVIMGASLALMLIGGGQLSLENKFLKRKR